MNHRILVLIIISVFGMASLIGQAGSVMIKSPENDLWGYVDLAGNELVKPQFKSASPFSKNGIARVRKDKVDVFIDTNGKNIKSSKFSDCKNTFNDGLVAVKNDKKKWGYMNAQGELVIPFQFSSISSFNSGYASVSKDDNWYVIDTEGKLSKFEGKLREIKKFSEGLAPYYSKDKLHGFVDGTATVVIKAKFKSVGYFSDGLAWAKNEKGEAGYIDKEGNWVIKPKYDAVGNFDTVSGLARVKLAGQWQYIDKSGAKYKAPSNTEKFGHFRSGFAKGKVGAKAGYYDKNMEWIIKPQFESIKDFHGDFAAAKKDGMWGVIDKTGNWVVSPKYIGIKDPVVFEK